MRFRFVSLQFRNQTFCSLWIVGDARSIIWFETVISSLHYMVGDFYFVMHEKWIGGKRQ